MRTALLLPLAAALLAAHRPVPVPVGPAAPPAPACDTIPAYHMLDFWLGEWDVREKDQVVGTNRIEKVAGGCALIENWRDVTGEEGKSLFYYLRGRREWKQVWVEPGGVKEKHLVARFPDGSVRFQGDLPRGDGSILLDRTTLTPLGNQMVRQVIEQSADGGRTWAVGFDAIYQHPGTPP